jgi:hypothetical protein
MTKLVVCANEGCGKMLRGHVKRHKKQFITSYRKEIHKNDLQNSWIELKTDTGIRKTDTCATREIGTYGFRARDDK